MGGGQRCCVLLKFQVGHRGASDIDCTVDSIVTSGLEPQTGYELS